MQIFLQFWKIYLDTCCLSRLVDDDTQDRILREAGAVETILITGAISKRLRYGGVRYIAAGGNPSSDLVYRAAGEIVSHLREGQDTRIFYIGDFDPTGRDIFFSPISGLQTKLPRYVEHRLQTRLTESQMALEWISVTEEDIETTDVKVREQKHELSKSQQARFPWSFALEVDALPPEVIQRKVHACLDATLDDDAFVKVNQFNLREHQRVQGLKNAVNGKLDELEAEGWDIGESFEVGD